MPFNDGKKYVWAPSENKKQAYVRSNQVYEVLRYHRSGWFYTPVDLAVDAPRSCRGKKQVYTALASGSGR